MAYMAIKNLIEKFTKSKEATNAGWIIGEKIVQMLLSLIVGILSARYLGPSNYGLVNYAATYISFFTSFATLGIDSILVKELVDNPNRSGEILGTAIGMRVVSGLLSVIFVVSAVWLLDTNEPLTLVVAALSSLSLIFRAFESINSYFLSKYLSKITSIAALVSYIALSFYKIVLLVLNKDVKWFAFATSVDYVVLAIFLLICYFKNSNQKLYFSWKRAKEMLSRSHHYILTGMMVAIYAQTDKIMLKQMLDTSAVGYYTTASSVANLWTFIIAAIVTVMNPTIIGLYGKDEAQFNRKMRQLYAIVFYISISASLCIVLCSGIVIRKFYGEAYAPAIAPLRVITWNTAFSYFGVARNIWVVCKNRQKYLKYIYISSSILNIALNAFLIPIMGVTGAAIASVIAQVTTGFLFPLFIKDMRESSVMMLDAILFRGIR